MEFPYVIFQSFYSISFIFGLIGKNLKIIKTELSIHLDKKRDKNAKCKCIKPVFLIEYQAK